MLILEKDIFKYIFYPEYLSLEKSKYILNNQDKYMDEIKLLLNIKESLKETVNEEIVEKIKNKILERKKDFIELNRINYQLNSLNYPVIAADSPKLERELRTDTYCDAASSFLIKVLTSKEENRIYVFSKNLQNIEDFKLNIEPSGESFSISQNEPLIISPRQDITGISISE